MLCPFERSGQLFMHPYLRNLDPLHGQTYSYFFLFMTQITSTPKKGGHSCTFGKRIFAFRCRVLCGCWKDYYRCCSVVRCPFDASAACFMFNLEAATHPVVVEVRWENNIYHLWSASRKYHRIHKQFPHVTGTIHVGLSPSDRFEPIRMRWFSKNPGRGWDTLNCWIFLHKPTYIW